MTRVLRTALLLTLSGAQTGCYCEDHSDSEPAHESKTEKATVAKAAARKQQNESIIVEGKRRNYMLHFPRRPREKGPLMVMLTEQEGAPERFSGRSDVITGASKLGYLLAIPQASTPGWDHGMCQEDAALADGKDAKGDTALGDTTQADVVFIGTLVEELAKRADVDPRRVYLLGTNAGAALAAATAQTYSAKIAAIALNLSESVCGSKSWGRSPDDAVTPKLVIQQGDADVGEDPTNGVPRRSALEALLQTHDCGRGNRPVSARADGTSTPTKFDCKGAALLGVDVPRADEPWPRKIGSRFTLRVVHEFFARHRR